jgi:PAS domain S-box-containing protein
MSPRARIDWIEATDYRQVFDGWTQGASPRGDGGFSPMDLRAYPVAGEGAPSAEASEPGLAQITEDAVLDGIAPLTDGLVFIHDFGGGRMRYGRSPLSGALGLPEDSADPALIRDLVHPADRAALRRHARQELRLPDRAVADVTLRMRGREGGWLWCAIRSRVLDRDAAGEVRRLIGIIRDVTHDHETARVLARSALALARAELNERRRLGRELHDSTSQLLVAARLGLAALESRVPLTGEPRRIVSGVRRSIAAAQREIRNLSYLLHPPQLQADSLQKALEEFGAGFGQRTGLAVSVSVAGGPWALSGAVELALFRITQEALMNVYRHARARRATVRLFRDGRAVVLEVEDDGTGLASAGGRTAAPIGVGVSGMQARMAQLGGSLVLDSSDSGLTVRARAPLALN